MNNGQAVHMDTRTIIVLTVKDAAPVDKAEVRINRWKLPLDLDNLKVLPPTTPREKGKYIAIQPADMTKSAPFLLASKTNYTLPSNAKRYKCTICARSATYICSKNPHHVLCRTCIHTSLSHETCPLCTIIVGVKPIHREE